MKKPRFSEEQIIGILHEPRPGVSIAEVARRHGITTTTFHRWRAKYGGLVVSEAKRLKAVEEENRRLKRLVAELSLDNAMLKDVAGRRW